MSDQPTPTSQPSDPAVGLDPAALLQRGINTTPPIKRPPPQTPAELEAQLPELAVHEVIGQGGMGAVYRATQRNLDRPVALKVMARELGADPAFAARFVREAKAMARLSHPGIVAVHDFGQRGDLCWLVMELVDGANLREVMRTGQLSPDQALAIVPQLCDALQYAHDEGVIHRDIKPENILLDQRGRVKITDFGLAKVSESDRPLGEALTASGDRLGTVHYMAPEQVEGAKSVDHRVDIYSLGVVFYEMLTGGLPLGRFEPPSRRIAVDVHIDEVVLKALEKDPQRRWQQASEVQRAVESGSGIRRAAKEAGAQKPTVQSDGVPGWVPFAAILVAPVVLLVIWFANWLPRTEPAVSAASASDSTTDAFDLERERAAVRRFLQLGDLTAARAGIVRIVNRDPAAEIDDLIRDADIVESAERVRQEPETLATVLRELQKRHPQDAVVSRYVIKESGEWSGEWDDCTTKAARALGRIQNLQEFTSAWYALYPGALEDVPTSSRSAVVQHLVDILVQADVPADKLRDFVYTQVFPEWSPLLDFTSEHFLVLERKELLTDMLRVMMHLHRAVTAGSDTEAKAEAEQARNSAGATVVLSHEHLSRVIRRLCADVDEQRFNAVAPLLVQVPPAAVWEEVFSDLEQSASIFGVVDREKVEREERRLVRLRELLTAVQP